jgi:hypothetical protein
VMASGGTFPYTGTGSYFIAASSLYPISISDQNGCTADTVINVQLVNDSIVTTVNYSSVCPHAILAFSVANDILDPVWYPGNFSGYTYNIYNLLTDTVVTMLGITSDGCMTSQSFDVTMEDCTSSPSLENTGFSAVVYPSPATSFFMLEIAGDKQYSAIMIDATGRKVKELFKTRLEGKYLVNVQELASGIYFTLISETESGNVITRKVLID